MMTSPLPSPRMLRPPATDCAQLTAVALTGGAKIFDDVQAREGGVEIDRRRRSMAPGNCRRRRRRAPVPPLELGAPMIRAYLPPPILAPATEVPRPVIDVFEVTKTMPAKGKPSVVPEIGLFWVVLSS